jgi:prolyl-tRNA synthetase
VEIGANELAEGTLTHVRRDIGRDSKTSANRAEFVGYAANLLKQIQADMLKRARDFRDSMIIPVASVAEIKDYYEQGGNGLVRAPLSVLDNSAFDEIADTHSLTARCIPFDGDGDDVLIGRSY